MNRFYLFRSVGCAAFCRLVLLGAGTVLGGPSRAPR